MALLLFPEEHLFPLLQVASFARRNFPGLSPRTRLPDPDTADEERRFRHIIYLPPVEWCSDDNTTKDLEFAATRY